MVSTSDTSSPSVVHWGSSRFAAQALADILSRQTHLRVQPPVSSASELLATLESAPVDLVIMDAGVPDAGPMVRYLAEQYPMLPILVAGVDHEFSDLLTWFEFGATACITREEPLIGAVGLVIRAAAGEIICPGDLSVQLVRRLSESWRGDASSDASVQVQLTNRELQILSLVDLGDSNKTIARKLGISPATVKNHVHNILRKLQVSRRLEATQFLRGTIGR